jgi:hypothetical protein
LPRQEAAPDAHSAGWDGPPPWEARPLRPPRPPRRSLPSGDRQGRPAFALRGRSARRGPNPAGSAASGCRHSAAGPAPCGRCRALPDFSGHAVGLVPVPGQRPDGGGLRLARQGDEGEILSPARPRPWPRFGQRSQRGRAQLAGPAALRPGLGDGAPWTAGSTWAWPPTCSIRKTETILSSACARPCSLPARIYRRP